MLARKAALIIVAARLVACQSGNPETHTGSAPPPLPGEPQIGFEGTWQGTITYDDTMTSLNAIVMVNGWGELRLLAGESQFVGFPRRLSSALEGNLTGLRSPGSVWSDGTRVSSFTISGSIDADYSIDATLSGDVGGASLKVAREPALHSTSIDTIEGTWVAYDGNRNPVATFEFSTVDIMVSVVTGAHANGCTFSGGADTWTSYNAYDITGLDIRDCPEFADFDMDGDYSGTAALLDVTGDDTDELSLVFAISDDDLQLTYFLYRP